jgi:hypothetical protein
MLLPDGCEQPPLLGRQVAAATAIGTWRRAQRPESA